MSTATSAPSDTEQENVAVFISYRREEASYLAGWLHDYLTDRIGDHRVFLDIDAIRPGVDFMRTITSAVSQAKVMLVLIGPRWLRDFRGTCRLLEPADPVRAEIRTALAAGLLVVPVLFDGTEMPAQEDLPAELVRLRDLHAVTMSHSSFQAAAARIVEAIEPFVGFEPDGRVRPAHSTPVGVRLRSDAVVEQEVMTQQRLQLIRKLRNTYSEYLRQAVNDDRILAVPLTLKLEPDKTYLPTNDFLRLVTCRPSPSTAT